jgi:hypothetical protein
VFLGDIACGATVAVIARVLARQPGAVTDTAGTTAVEWSSPVAGSGPAAVTAGRRVSHDGGDQRRNGRRSWRGYARRPRHPRDHQFGAYRHGVASASRWDSPAPIKRSHSLIGSSRTADAAAAAEPIAR